MSTYITIASPNGLRQDNYTDSLKRLAAQLLFHQLLRAILHIGATKAYY
jgi:hypothetical protein